MPNAQEDIGISASWTLLPLTKNMLADMHCIFTIRIWRRRKAFKSNLILFGPAAIALSFSESELPRL